MTPSAGRIKERRLAKKLSQTGLAERAGISQATVSTYEAAAETAQRVDVILKIAAALETSPEYLLTGMGPRDLREISGTLQELHRVAAGLDESQLAALISVARTMTR